MPLLINRCGKHPVLVVSVVETPKAEVHERGRPVGEPGRERRWTAGLVFDNTIILEGAKAGPGAPFCQIRI
jgi:hypothetical protein